ncbi:hypothetical protein ACPOL_3373 [Acidisarcina polymorpha]|uniref:Uncharacterized protein n=1 Tax=Acidisarcina polymorpha TaxID=2211140 RepID=A0A2Z5G0N0_9BACT|nr:hypothetical protein ACPOL_3373 [Acidisarcina polymorpha]
MRIPLARPVRSTSHLVRRVRSILVFDGPLDPLCFETISKRAFPVSLNGSSAPWPGSCISLEYHHFGLRDRDYILDRSFRSLRKRSISKLSLCKLEQRI